MYIYNLNTKKQKLKNAKTIFRRLAWKLRFMRGIIIHKYEFKKTR